VEKLEFLRVSAVAAFGRRRMPMPPPPQAAFPDAPSPVWHPEFNIFIQGGPGEQVILELPSDTNLCTLYDAN